MNEFNTAANASRTGAGAGTLPLAGENPQGRAAVADDRADAPDSATVSAAQLAAWRQGTGAAAGPRGRGAQVIDVRSPGEFATGHVPGAVNIPMQEVEARVADLLASGNDDEAAGPVVLVCQSGRRAAMTRDLLRAAHPALPVAVLDGGTDAWVRAGLPVVRSSATRWSLERQVRVGAGLLVLAGTVLSVTVAPAWVYLAMFVGAGLTFAGLTNVCGMALLLAKMPWNRAKPARGCGV